MDKRTIIEAIGLAAVVASLLFVGVQLRQDQRLAEADQYFSRAESRMETVRSLFSNRDYVEEEAERWESLRPRWWNPELDQFMAATGQSMAAMVRVSFNSNMTLIAMDNIHYQYELGLIDESVWLAAENTLRIVLTRPMLRAVMASENFILRPGFRQVVQSILADLEAGS